MAVNNDQSLIYLDHNANTPVAPQVLDAMLPYLRDQYGNPSSDHPPGRRRATAAVDLARAQGRRPGRRRPGRHHLHLRWHRVQQPGHPWHRRRHRRGAAPHRHHRAGAPCHHRTLSASGNPGLDHHPPPGHPRRLNRHRHGGRRDGPRRRPGHDDAGAKRNRGNLACRGHRSPRPRAGAVVHTDAAQAIGKIDVDVTDLDVDLLSIAGHKCYAPKGVGALYRRPGTPINPVLLGAGQEHGLRPGTENVAGIVGLGAACDLARTHLTAETKQLACLRHTLWQLLNAAVPGLVRHTPEVALPNTLTVSFPGVLGRDVLAHAAGLAASTGSACHSGQETPSATLLAMGVPPATALGSVRLSWAAPQLATDISTAATILVTAHALASAS